MLIFTDASITYGATKKPLFSTHSIVICDDTFSVKDIKTWVHTGIENINQAEQKSINYAIEHALPKTIIYTDSLQTYQKPTRKLKSNLKQKNIKLKWSSRKYNQIADFACRVIRRNITSTNIDTTIKYTAQDIVKIKQYEQQLKQHQKQEHTISKTRIQKKQREKQYKINVKMPKPQHTKTYTNLFDMPDTHINALYRKIYTNIVKKPHRMTLAQFKCRFRLFTWYVQKTNQTREYAVLICILYWHEYHEIEPSVKHFKM